MTRNLNIFLRKTNDAINFPLLNIWPSLSKSIVKMIGSSSLESEDQIYKIIKSFFFFFYKNVSASGDLIYHKTVFPS